MYNFDICLFHCFFFSFQVLCLGEFAWEFASNGSVPSDAIVAGQTSDGEPLYIGRVLHNGSQTVGKVGIGSTLYRAGKFIYNARVETVLK